MTNKENLIAVKNAAKKLSSGEIHKKSVDILEDELTEMFLALIRLDEEGGFNFQNVMNRVDRDLQQHEPLVGT